MESTPAPFDIDTYVVRPESERGPEWQPDPNVDYDAPFALK
jgi:hypothetical protein